MEGSMEGSMEKSIKELIEKVAEKPFEEINFTGMEGWDPELLKQIDELDIKSNPHYHHIQEHDEFKIACIKKLAEGEIDRLTYKKIVQEHGFQKIRDMGQDIIMNTKLEIGGSKMDKKYGEWLDIWYEADSNSMVS